MGLNYPLGKVLSDKDFYSQRTKRIPIGVGIAAFLLLEPFTRSTTIALVLMQQLAQPLPLLPVPTFMLNVHSTKQLIVHRQPLETTHTPQSSYCTANNSTHLLLTQRAAAKFTRIQYLKSPTPMLPLAMATN